ncbi:MAG: radical SAM protein [Phycisphaerae bacterium SM23_30]|nr:MAG: radical SAM protein [Phycisphaerae bacterium SM23_30]
MGDKFQPACMATLRKRDGKLERLIKSIHLSRPENYLSIYQSGCNFSCRKCHSWDFSQKVTGDWFSVEELLTICRYYEKQVTLIEPRNKATAWHAGESCRCCGQCVINGEKSPMCPGVLEPEQIILSPQGYGPARNIVAFTGGDLTCRAQFYAEFTQQVKAETRLWILIETNGLGLTPKNLDKLQKAGVDAFWLDIKAYDDKAHNWLTGCTNQWILELPKEILQRGFVLEVLSLYIPDLVETDQLRQIAELLCSASAEIPFTILAFFPEYKMMNFRVPTLDEMLEAYTAAKNVGLKNVRLGNIGVFAKTQSEVEKVIEMTGTAG